MGRPGMKVLSCSEPIQRVRRRRARRSAAVSPGGPAKHADGGQLLCVRVSVSVCVDGPYLVRRRGRRPDGGREVACRGTVPQCAPAAAPASAVQRWAAGWRWPRTGLPPPPPRAARAPPAAAEPQTSVTGRPAHALYVMDVISIVLHIDYIRPPRTHLLLSCLTLLKSLLSFSCSWYGKSSPQKSQSIIDSILVKVMCGNECYFMFQNNKSSEDDSRAGYNAEN